MAKKQPLFRPWTRKFKKDENGRISATAWQSPWFGTYDECQEYLDAKWSEFYSKVILPTALFPDRYAKIGN